MRSFLLTLLATLIIGVANVNAQVTLSGSVRDTDTSNHCWVFLLRLWEVTFLQQPIRTESTH